MSEMILTRKHINKILIDSTYNIDELPLEKRRFIEESINSLVDSHHELDQKYRKALWVSHGCDSAGLYGDDGEMQCRSQRKEGVRRHIPLDFKRDTILHLETELGKMKLTESGITIPGLNDKAVEI